MKKILIIGVSGQIGGALREILEKNKKFKIIKADKIKSKNVSFLDITQKQEVAKFFKKTKPQIIILPAALTDVDACETMKTLAYDINVKSVINIIRLAQKIPSKLIYISTAYVFDGKKGNYSENDKPHPINYYAKTKLMAEKIIQKNLNDYLIIRTNWVFDFGYDKKNFAVRLLDILKNEKMFMVPKDQCGNPTLARNIASAIEELILKNKNGIYHIVGKDKMSKYQWAIKIAKHFKLNHKLIIPALTKNLGQKALRPPKSDLNITKAINELNTKIFSLKESMSFLEKRIYDHKIS